MSKAARIRYTADGNYVDKQAKEFTLTTEIIEKLDSIEPSAERNAIQGIKVNGQVVEPDQYRVVSLAIPEVEDNLDSISSTNALSTKQGRVLYNRIKNLEGLGKFLSNWDSTTGLPTTNPTALPYEYHSGDYYIVGRVGATNYRPEGTSYRGIPSTDLETEEVKVGDFYFFNGATWELLLNTDRQIPIDESLSTTSTNPVENRVVTAALNLKANDADISVVGKTNDFNDLDNIPNIPDSLDDLTGTSDDITEGASHLFLTTAERGKLSQTSGVNTGDETNASIMSKLGAASSTTNGYLTVADWNKFNDKQAAISDLETIRSNAQAGKDASDTIATYGDVVTHNANEFATAAQGGLADTAVQPGDNVSTLTNDAGYVTDAYHDSTKQDTLVAGNNIQIAADGVTISATDTTYIAGDFDIKDLADSTGLRAEWSGKQDELIAGNNIQIAADGKTISSTDTTYSAGPGISISANNVISANDNKATWGSIEGTLSDQADLKDALDAKQNNLTAGNNVQIVNDTISATDTTYTAGTGISISANNVISNTQTSAEWGNIQGNIEDQTDLQNALDVKADDSDVVHLSGTETITGVKTFTANSGTVDGTPAVISPRIRINGQTGSNKFKSQLDLFKGNTKKGYLGYFEENGSNRFEFASEETSIPFYLGLQPWKQNNLSIALTNQGIWRGGTSDTYSADKAFAVIGDLDKRIFSGATAPSSPTEGQLWYDTTNDVLNVYNGIQWNAVDTNTTYTAGTGISIDANNVISNTQTSAEWGNITGNIADQTDLQNAISSATSGAVSDTAYAASWDGITGIAPSKNTVYDKISAMDTTIAGKQNTISDLATIRTGAGKGATAVQPGDNISTLTNDSGFITKSVSDLTNYYTKSETYTKSEVADYVANFAGFKVVAQLPTTDIKTTIIYLLGPVGSGQDKYEEYIYSNNAWVMIGETSVDLTNYFNTSTDNSDSITQGSTNLFLTSAERTKLSNTSGTNTGDETKATIQSKLGAASSSASGYLTSTDWNTFNNKQAAISDLATIRSNATAGAGAATTIAGYGDIVTHDASEFLTTDKISDAAYASSWNGVTGVAPSKNAVYDKLSSMDTTISGKQNTISDLATIRSNASAGKSASDTIATYGDVVTHDASEFATSAQGSLASTAIQPNDNISELINDVGYITSASLPTVNNGMLTVKQNGTSKGTFTANQSGASTIELTDTTYSAGSGIDITNTTISTASIYGTSSTAAATTEKVVSIPSITSLNAGQVIIVKPTTTSSVANSTIKLNNFTAYPMRYNNAAITTSTNSVVWAANIPSMFMFDGTYWQFLGHGLDSNTTYSAMSVAEGTAGTATSARTVRADYLKQIIEHYVSEAGGNVIAVTQAEYDALTPTEKSDGKLRLISDAPAIEIGNVSSTDVTTIVVSSTAPASGTASNIITIVTD